MSESHEYNGWRNYETWAAKLWMDTTQHSQTLGERYAREAFEFAEATPTFTRQEQATLTLREWLKEWQERELPDLGASMAADLLMAAFGEIDWYEIAQHMIADAIEAVEA